MDFTIMQTGSCLKMEDKMEKRIARADFLLIGVLLLIGIVSFFVIRINQQSGSTVRVLVDGKAYGTYQLAKEQSIPIQIDGVVTNTLQIADGQANMTEADCPDQLCVHQNAISRQGETIVCLPNKIVVEVEKAEAAELDSVSR